MPSPDTDTSDDNVLTARDALEHAWNWFEHHANQRLTVIRFAVLVAVGVAAGIAYLQRENHFFFFMLLSIFGALVSYSFLRLDERTSDLVKIGERALVSIEATLAAITTNPFMNICSAASEEQNRYIRKLNNFPYTTVTVLS